MSLQVTVSGSTRPTNCPLCRAGLEVERAVMCDGCATAYHRGCLVDLGGCGTIGCARRGKVPGGLEPRVAARSNPAGGYLVAAGVAGATLVGLVGLSRLGTFLHRPVRQPSAMSFTPRPAPALDPSPPTPAPAPAPAPTSAPRPPATPRAGWTPIRTEASPPAEVATVDGRESRLAAVTRATEEVHDQLRLLTLCERAEAGRGEPWGRGLVARALQHAERDPVEWARTCVQRAREAGASDAALRAAAAKGPRYEIDSARAVELVLGSEPSPLSREELEPRLRAALAGLDREVARRAAALAFADALDGSIARDRVVAGLEGHLADPEVFFDPAVWRERLAGPDPHEIAREARRRFVAAGGDERPDLGEPTYERPAELRLAKLLEKAQGVLVADDAAPTPTRRVLAAIEARARQPRPR